ncbi:MAG: hypothetical protein M0P31_17690 [Solirubrobacteraceae bacterium]|nr:hypothetical protein [Solirubrobacteraceae bacterium]
MSTTDPTAAPQGARPEPPVVALDALTGPVADEARQTGRRLLEANDRHAIIFQSGGGPDSLIDHEARPSGVRFAVLDDAAVATGRAWHAYWRTNLTDRGTYATQDPDAMAAAPPKPTRTIAYVAAGTWEQLRGWLDAPDQLDLFDNAGGAAR